MKNRFYRLTVLSLVLLLTGCNTMTMYQSFSGSQIRRAGGTEKMLTLSDGGQLHYWERGEGEPLILIHGLGGDALMNWKEQMLDFNPEYKVIAPDLLWFGQSKSPNAQRSLSSQSDALFALMDHLGIDQAHVVGHSYGGFVAYKMMNEHQDRIKSLTLISSPGPIISDMELFNLTRRFETDSLETLFVPESPVGLKKLNYGIFHDPIPAPKFVYRDIYQTFIEPNKQAQRALIETLPKERDQFKSPDQKGMPPVFLIWGAGDKIFPLHTGIDLSRYLNAPIAILEEGAHAIPAENPEVVSRLLEAFLFKKP